MSGRTTIKPGGSIPFATRPIGLSTTLHLVGGAGGESQATWHIELCCQPDNIVNLKSLQPMTVDLTSAKGALVTVRNNGWREFDAWTDY